MFIKSLIKNTEARVASYKQMLEDVNRDKVNFPKEDRDVEWYKSILREGKNYEQIVLKRLTEEKQYDNQGLNAPYFYSF